MILMVIGVVGLVIGLWLVATGREIPEDST